MQVFATFRKVDEIRFHGDEESESGVDVDRAVGCCNDCGCGDWGAVIGTFRCLIPT